MDVEIHFIIFDSSIGIWSKKESLKNISDILMSNTLVPQETRREKTHSSWLSWEPQKKGFWFWKNIIHAIKIISYKAPCFQK